MVEAGSNDVEMPTRRTNSTAKVALACSIIEFAFPPIAIVAIILGHLAVREIRRTGQDGLGIATTALVLGYIGLLLAVFVPLLIGGWLSTGPIPNR